MLRPVLPLVLLHPDEPSSAESLPAVFISPGAKKEQ